MLHLHATGSRGVELFDKLEKKRALPPGENLVVTPYINNMPQLLAAADLVIARSGALTLAELEAVGRASILIPSPNVAENHQYYNALELQRPVPPSSSRKKNLTGEGADRNRAAAAGPARQAGRDGRQRQDPGQPAQLGAYHRQAAGTCQIMQPYCNRSGERIRGLRSCFFCIVSSIINVNCKSMLCRAHGARPQADDEHRPLQSKLFI